MRGLGAASAARCTESTSAATLSSGEHGLRHEVGGAGAVARVAWVCALERHRVVPQLPLAAREPPTRPLFVDCPRKEQVHERARRARHPALDVREGPPLDRHPCARAERARA
jgi:hypothetical protein